jgi:hypothetical protein
LAEQRRREGLQARAVLGWARFDLILSASVYFFVSSTRSLISVQVWLCSGIGELESATARASWTEMAGQGSSLIFSSDCSFLFLSLLFMAGLFL